MEHGVEEGKLPGYSTSDEIVHGYGGVLTITYFIEEVPNFKNFIEDGIAMGGNALLVHTKAQQFEFYANATECLVMKYKLLC